MSEAVVVVDMQNDFVYGKLRTERAEGIVPGVGELLGAARRAGRPVVFVGDAHFPTDPEIGVWGEHAMRGTEGARIIEELAPEASDTVLEKRTYVQRLSRDGALDLLLRSLGVDTVVICGLQTNICDRHTSADAFFRGYRIVIPENCVEALADKEQRSGLEYLEKVYGARITDSGALLREWSTSAAIR